MRNRRRYWTVCAVAVVALATAATTTAVTVAVDSRSASASWLGLTQPLVAAAPAIQPAKPAATVSYELWWGTVKNATAYRIWLDGKPNSVVHSDITAATQGRTVSLPCGTQHRWNIQGLNAHSVGPLNPTPSVWTTTPCP